MLPQLLAWQRLIRLSSKPLWDSYFTRDLLVNRSSGFYIGLIQRNIFKYESDSLADLLDMTSRKYDIILVDARGVCCFVVLLTYRLAGPLH